jgi:hypothetical protein
VLLEGSVTPTPAYAGAQLSPLAPPGSHSRSACTAWASARPGGLTIGAAATRATLRRVTPDSFVCPRCGLTSHRPTDVAEGYCSACHDWTSRGAATGLVDPQLQARAQELAWRAREQDGDPHRDVCAHCAAGNHDNCDGHAWCDAIGVGVDCTCALEDHPPFKGP